MKKDRKRKLVNVLKPELCPYWRYDGINGGVAIYIPDGSPLTIERANLLLDIAKTKILGELSSQC